MGDTSVISDQDRRILRDLAKRQMELANSDKNLTRVELWKRHIACKGERPIVHVEVETFADEVVKPYLQCTGDRARRIEFSMRKKSICFDKFDDDWVVPPYFPVGVSKSFRKFGLPVKKDVLRDKNGKEVGQHFHPYLVDLNEDYEKLKEPQFYVSMKDTKEGQAFANDIFGDILPAKICGEAFPTELTQHIVHIMSMEDMLFAMVDTPELFKKMIDRLADDFLTYYNLLLKNKAVFPTTGFEIVNQGSLAFTDELPDGEITSLSQIWGYMDSQETAPISPDMFRELIFPAYKKVGEKFGLLSFGCCEPVDGIWDCLSQFKNLRRVSISPWCNEELMGDRLRGKKIIYHRKPSPNFLGVDRVLDEENFRKHIRKTLSAAKGCELEFTQRDVYTVPSIEAVHRYVQVIREEIEDNWGK